MPKRTGERNISCSVIRNHRIRNGFSTSRGFSVWLTYIPIVRFRSGIIGPTGFARRCRDSKDMQRLKHWPQGFQIGIWHKSPLPLMIYPFINRLG